MLLRFEDVIERQTFGRLTGAEPDFELGSVAAQASESDDLSQPGLYFSPVFGVDVLAQPSDLQSLLEGCLLIFAKEDVDRIFPLSQPLFACHHHRPAQLRVIPLFTPHALPPFLAMVLRKR